MKQEISACCTESKNGYERLTQDVVYLNNSAVYCLANGFTNQARTLLRKALELTTRTMQNSGREEDSEYYTEEPHTIVMQKVALTLLQENQTEPSIFSYAIALSIKDSYNHNCKDHECCLREYVVIMFNLGLVHHLRGVNLRVPSLLPRALQLYQTALNVLEESNSSSYNNIGIALAVLNNMRQIYLELAEYPKARQCFESIQDLILLAEPEMQQVFFQHLTPCAGDTRIKDKTLSVLRCTS